jgi:glycosyltransferase involved in cell wall biosynthesis
MHSSVKMPFISVIIPTYNEAENIRPVYQAVKKATQGLAYYFEILFVDDGSDDDTVEEVKSIAEHDPRVVSLELVRNFGKEIALTAGLRAAHGEAAIMLDADLQHPPDHISQFISKWERGADLVVGVRRAYKASWLKRRLSSLYYKLINRISDIELVPHATDYRLVDRQVIEAFNQFTEHSRITRGLFDWLGFQRDYIYFDANERQNGQASYSFRKLVRLAIDSFISHTLLPLHLAGYIGAFMMLTTLPLGVFIFIDRYLFHNNLFGVVFSGTAILAVISLFLSGVTLTCLGLISLYIENIHKEVVNRPLFVARRAARQQPRHGHGAHQMDRARVKIGGRL